MAPQTVESEVIAFLRLRSRSPAEKAVTLLLWAVLVVAAWALFAAAGIGTYELTRAVLL
jgi:hypothetical protein